jgi:hypothetical protein
MAMGAMMAIILGAASVEAAPTDRERARDKLAQGVRLLSARDFASALARFDEAYALFPTPKLHYNRGLALEGLGRHADAFVAFNRFIEETKDPSPEYVKHARREIEQLKTQVAFIDVTTDAAGVEVRLDGDRLGITPLAPVPVEPGKHELAVHVSDGEPDTVQRVMATAGERLNVKMEVRRAPTAAGGAPTARGGGPVAKPDIPTLTGPAQPQPSSEGSWQRTAVWGSAVAAAGALSLGIYETVAFRTRKSEFDNLSEPDPNDMTKRLALCGGDDLMHGRDKRCAALYDQAHTALTFAIVGYAGAAALTGISVFLFQSGSSRSSTGQATAWTCGVGPRSAACRFTF